MAFHWHGDTFDLPSDAVWLAQSEGCLHQAFAYRDRVIELQFHLESTRESIELLCTNCAGEIETAPTAKNRRVFSGRAMVGWTT